MFGPFPLDKSVYENYTADDPRTRRRLSLYETSIWGPASLSERSAPLDFGVVPENVPLFRPGNTQMAQPVQSQYNPLDQSSHRNSNSSLLQNFPLNLASNQGGYLAGVQNYSSPTSQWSPPRRMLSTTLAGSDQYRLYTGEGLPSRKSSDQGVNYLPMLQGHSRYTQQNMAPNLWNDSPWRTSFPGEKLEDFPSNATPEVSFSGTGVARNMPTSATPAYAPPNIEQDRSLSNSFLQGVSLTSHLQSGPLRRHSYGEGFGFAGQAHTNSTQKSSHLASQSQQDVEDPQTLATVHEYFTADPHERVKVTTDYLEQRFFDEEKYLGDLYQLPKFPVEDLLRNYLLVLVGFKAGRIDVFYMPDNVEELKSVKVGDLIFVEADRGRDLGKVVKMNISIDEARLLKLLQFLEQQAAISDHLTVNDLSVKTLQNTGGNHHGHHGANSPPTLHFPKSILTLAQPNEAIQILNKKQDEEKACRLCLAKIASTTNMLSSGDTQSTLTSSDLMQMKLIDAEYQFDRRKLIFYYSTSKRIDFRDLVRELFRIYKTRIWMCAVNGIPYVPQHQKNRGTKNVGQNRNGQHHAGSGSAGPNGNVKNTGTGNPTANQGNTNVSSPTQFNSTTGHYSSFGERPGNGMLAERRSSYHSGTPVYNRRLQHEFVLELGVPRNYRDGGRLDEESASHRDSGESLVLKSLVDTLNH